MEFKDENALIKFILKAVLPEWQAKLFKRNREAIQVHSQGKIFYKIDRLFPNENPQSKAHRILSFESITEASFGRAANNVNRIFKNSSYSVSASERTIKELSSHDFDGQNFYGWFLDQWTSIALKDDPNALIVVYPPEYFLEKDILPVRFVKSEHIKYMTDEALIFVSEEESEVDYDIEETKVQTVQFHDQSINRWNFMESYENTFAPTVKAHVKRPVYHAFFHGLGFVRLEKTRGKEKEFEYSLYTYNPDFIPAIDVGGEKSGKVNKSFLHPFVPFGNLALLQHSQHTAVNFMFSFPRMSEIETPCEAPGCQNGQIACETEADVEAYGDFKPCKSCGGTGYVVPQSPYKVYKKRYDPAGMEGDNKHIEVPDVQYYTPDTAILDYSKKEWKDYLEAAETAVYIQQRVKTGGIESAKSKEIDRDDLYAFLSKVGQVYFSRLRFTIQCFENFLVANPTQVTVENPYSYAILSEGEAFSELKDILQSNVPVMIKANRVESFISKFVSASSPIRKFIDVLKLVDPLLYYSKDELTAWKLASVVSAQQMAVHVFSYPVLQNMYFRDPKLFDQDTLALVEKVKKELEAYKPEEPKPLQDTLRDNLDQ